MTDRDNRHCCSTTLKQVGHLGLLEKVQLRVRRTWLCCCLWSHQCREFAEQWVVRARIDRLPISLRKTRWKNNAFLFLKCKRLCIPIAVLAVGLYEELAVRR